MAIDVKNGKTMLGNDTVDPYTPVDVVVEGIRWTFGPNFKQCVQNDGVQTEMTAFNANAKVSSSQDEDNNSVRT